MAGAKIRKRATASPHIALYIPLAAPAAPCSATADVPARAGNRRASADVLGLRECALRRAVGISPPPVDSGTARRHALAANPVGHETSRVPARAKSVRHTGTVQATSAALRHPDDDLRRALPALTCKAALDPHAPE